MKAKAAVKEIYISVDVETTGPVPYIYSMYELGACVVGDPSKNFSAKLALLDEEYEPEALEACGRTIEELKKQGDDPGLVMKLFDCWVRSVSPGCKPVFVGFAAPFDWMFVHWYFHAFIGSSPFGFCGLDIKAYYMGLMGCAWSETTSKKIDPLFRAARPLTHNALDDATQQAEMFAKMLKYTVRS